MIILSVSVAVDVSPLVFMVWFCSGEAMATPWCGGLICSMVRPSVSLLDWSGPPLLVWKHTKQQHVRDRKREYNIMDNPLIVLILSSLNLQWSSSSTTSRELLSQFSSCSGWRWFWVGGKIKENNHVSVNQLYGSFKKTLVVEKLSQFSGM